MSGFDETQKAALRRLLLGNPELSDTAVPLLPSADGDKDPLIALARYMNAILDPEIVARVPPTTLEALGFKALSPGSLAQFCIGLKSQHREKFVVGALQQLPMPRTPQAKREFLKALVADEDLFKTLPLHRTGGKTPKYGPLVPTGWVVHHDVSADHLPHELKDGKGEVHLVYHGDSDLVVYNKQREFTDNLDYAVLLTHLVTTITTVQDRNARGGPAITVVKVLQNIEDPKKRADLTAELSSKSWIPSGQQLLSPPVLYFGEVHEHLAKKCQDKVQSPPDTDLIKADTTNLFVVPVTEKVADYLDAYWSTMGLKELVALGTGDHFNTWLKELPAADDPKAEFAGLAPLVRLRDWLNAFKSWVDVKPDDKPAMAARDAILKELFQRPMPKGVVNDCFQWAATKLKTDPKQPHDAFRTVVASLWSPYMNDQGSTAGQWAAALLQRHGSDHAREVLHRVLGVVSAHASEDHFRVFPAHERPDGTLGNLPPNAVILKRPNIDEWAAWKKLGSPEVDDMVVFDSEHKTVRDRQRQLNPTGDPAVGQDILQHLISATLVQPYLCHRVLEVVEACALSAYPAGKWVACYSGSAQSPRYESICHDGLYHLDGCHEKVYRTFSKEVQPPVERHALKQLVELDLVARNAEAWSRVLKSISPNGYGRLVEPQGPLLPAPGIDGPFGGDRKVEALLNLFANTDGDDDGNASTGHLRQALEEVQDALAERGLPDECVIDVFESLTKRFFDEAQDPAGSDGPPAVCDDYNSLKDTDWWSPLFERYCALANTDSTTFSRALRWLSTCVAPQGNCSSVDLTPGVDSVAQTILRQLLAEGNAWHQQDRAILRNTMMRTNLDRRWRRAELLTVTQAVGDADRVADDLADKFTADSPTDDKDEELASYVDGTGLSHDTQWRTKLGLLVFALGAPHYAKSLVDEHTWSTIEGLATPSSKKIRVAAQGVGTVNLLGEPLGGANEPLESLLISTDGNSVRLHHPSRLKQTPNVTGALRFTIQRLCSKCGLTAQSECLTKAFDDVDGSALWSLTLYEASLRNLNEWLDSGVPEIDKLLAGFEGREFRQYAQAPVAGIVPPISPDEFERDVMKSALERHAERLEDIAKLRIESRGYSANSVLFELLQNADDALLEARALGYDKVRPEIELSLGPVEFRFVHFGRPIGEVRSKPGVTISVDEARTRRWRWDLRAMLRWGTTTKLTRREDGSQEMMETGFYGLGFKSIFTIAREPAIRSGLLSFKILGAKVPRRFGHPDPHEAASLTEKGPYGRTEIVLPLRKDARDTPKGGVRSSAEEAADHFERLVPYSLLFTQVVNSAKLLRGSALVEHHWTRPNPEDPGIRGLVFQEAKTKRKVMLVGEPLPSAGVYQSPSDLRFARFAFVVDDQLNVLPPEEHLPRVWVLAPTKADAGQLPFLVNATFTVNEGRGDLRQGADQNAAVGCLVDALDQLVVRLERSPTDERDRFVRSLWDAFGKVSLPEHGTARSFLDLVLWGPTGLLRWIAAEFGAPLQGSDRPMVLVNSTRTILLLHEPLITFYCGAEDEFRKYAAQAYGDEAAVAFDLPPGENSMWCPKHILGRLKLPEKHVKEVTLKEAPQAVRDAIDGKMSQSTVLTAAMLRHSVNTTLAGTLTEAAVQDARDTLWNVLQSAHGLLHDSAPAGPHGVDGQSAARRETGRLTDQAAREAIAYMCKLAATTKTTDKWHSSWHNESPSLLLKKLADGISNDQHCINRDAWMRMFCLGTTQALNSQQTPMQQRGFVEHLKRQGWWSQLFDTPPEATRWFSVLNDWSSRRKDTTSPFDWWMGALPELFVAANDLDDYAKQLTYLGIRPDPHKLLVALADPELQGSGHKAAAVPRLRASWVVRELARIGLYQKLGVPPGDMHRVHIWCFAPTTRLATALYVLGCNVTDPRTSKDWRKEKRGITSPDLWAAWVARCNKLGISDHTLHNTFDLPLISTEFAAYLKAKHRIFDSASE